MSTAIEFENISKQYRLGKIGTGTISHDLNRWWHNVRGKEDPYLKIGQVNDRAVLSKDGDYVWALKDITFSVEKGDVVGIIGKNGAGKSTLLKILSKVTTPTTGSIKARGRIASLLEVGTGFHPEMTGRENVYMNGSIMGMTKAEITRKFDEIVDFAGVAKYIDTPAKRYSSGMAVRLGFAVAAFLEPEILVVDEVLAVGDAEFQKKAIGKMQDVSKGEGRTVLFVSHNMGSIGQLCKSACILKDGKIDFEGNVNEGIERYLNDNMKISDNVVEQILSLPDNDIFQLIKIDITQEGIKRGSYYTNQTIEISFDYKVKEQCSGLRIGFDVLKASTGMVLFITFHDDYANEISIKEKGIYTSKCIIPAYLFLEGEYIISVSIGIHKVKWLVYEQIQIPLDFHNVNGINKIYVSDYRPGVINPLMKWETY